MAIGEFARCLDGHRQNRCRQRPHVGAFAQFVCGMSLKRGRFEFRRFGKPNLVNRFYRPHAVRHVHTLLRKDFV